MVVTAQKAYVVLRGILCDTDIYNMGGVRVRVRVRVTK